MTQPVNDAYRRTVLGLVEPDEHPELADVWWALRRELSRDIDRPWRPTLLLAAKAVTETGCAPATAANLIGAAVAARILKVKHLWFGGQKIPHVRAPRDPDLVALEAQRLAAAHSAIGSAEEVQR